MELSLVTSNFFSRGGVRFSSSRSLLGGVRPSASCKFRVGGEGSSSSNRMSSQFICSSCCFLLAVGFGSSIFMRSVLAGLGTEGCSMKYSASVLLEAGAMFYCIFDALNSLLRFWWEKSMNSSKLVLAGCYLLVVRLKKSVLHTLSSGLVDTGGISTTGYPFTGGPLYCFGLCRLGWTVAASTLAAYELSSSIFFGISLGRSFWTRNADRSIKF